MGTTIPRVGAPDPTLDTSPILDEADEVSLDDEIETGVCYFNGAAYPLGSYVLSGEEVLHCERKGVWVRASEVLPEDLPG